MLELEICKSIHLELKSCKPWFQVIHIEDQGRGVEKHKSLRLDEFMRERNLALRYIFPLWDSVTLNCNFSTGIAFCQRICTPHTNCLLWEGWVRDRWRFASLCKMQCNALFLQLPLLLSPNHLIAGGGWRNQGRVQDIWQPADPVNYTVWTTQNCPGLQVCRQMYWLWLLP